MEECTLLLLVINARNSRRDCANRILPKDSVWQCLYTPMRREHSTGIESPEGKDEGNYLPTYRTSKQIGLKIPDWGKSRYHMNRLGVLNLDLVTMYAY